MFDLSCNVTPPHCVTSHKIEEKKAGNSDEVHLRVTYEEAQRHHG